MLVVSDGAAMDSFNSCIAGDVGHSFAADAHRSYVGFGIQFGVGGLFAEQLAEVEPFREQGRASSDVQQRSTKDSNTIARTKTPPLE
jgi:hypothetical protein